MIAMKRETLIIYYNPRCSKCRDAAAIAVDAGYSTELIRYLDAPPAKEELRGILQKLGIKPLQLIRQKEAIFKEKFAGLELTDEEWLNVMIKHPVLIERPIVIRGDKAVIARPAEKISEVL